MYFGMDKLRPDFKVVSLNGYFFFLQLFSYLLCGWKKKFDAQVVHDVLSVMEKDALITSHPVSVVVEDPKQVQQYFDEIAYEKGLSVLRMMRGFIGDINFRKGLRVLYSNSKKSRLCWHDWV
jgi:aminopeptidase N